MSLPHSAAHVQGDFAVNVWMGLEVQLLGPPLLGAWLGTFSGSPEWGMKVYEDHPAVTKSMSFRERTRSLLGFKFGLCLLLAR